jgi:hypothetical protein
VKSVLGVQPSAIETVAGGGVLEAGVLDTGALDGEAPDDAVIGLADTGGVAEDGVPPLELEVQAATSNPRPMRPMRGKERPVGRRAVGTRTS